VPQARWDTIRPRRAGHLVTRPLNTTLCGALRVVGGFLA
jgi:hypothetical protein